ncbi:hypothetical protein GCM10007906_30660 [Vibrio hyugaensis]|uniref:Oligosaccharide flippase family protein n=2 Tax=Vibrio hyugaensis TaxID=1534743 RepID=A0ABQ5Y3J1_9VIBR|nr:hypothetical protein GCM10007906_30660 [Vibrio hyugaensis]
MKVITDFGFDISLAKKITDRRRSKRKIGSYLYQSWVIKLLLIFVVLIAFSIVHFNTELYKHTEYSLITLSTIIVSAINPSWLFSGIEKNHVLARIITASRTLSLIAVFVLIKNASDYTIYAYIMLINELAIITASHLIIMSRYKIKPVRSKLKNSLQTGKDSLSFFLAKSGVVIYSSGSTMFLGAFGGMNQIALYSAAERLHSAGNSAMMPIIAPLTPYMNRTKNYKLFYKIVVITVIIAWTGILFGFMFGDEIISIMFGSWFSESKQVLDILLVSLSISIIGMLFGYPALLPIGQEKHANLSVVIGGALQIVMLSSILLFDIEITAITIAITLTFSNTIATAYRIIMFISKIKNEKHSSTMR